MMGPTHRIWGAHQGAVLGGLTGALWGPSEAVTGVLIWAGVGWACATLPDRLERPLGFKHRGPTHWPEPPILLGLLFLAAAASPFGPIWWSIFMALAGVCNSWLSHWTGDYIFGKAHVAEREDGSFTVIRPRGVPYNFGKGYKGLGFKVNSDGEHRFRKVLNFTITPVMLSMLYFCATQVGNIYLN